MSDYSFPSADQLDRLRAGLLDDDPVLKRKIQDSVADKPTTDGIWERICRELDGSLERFPALRNQLRLRRRAALTGRRRSSSGIPALAVAAMASLAMFAGLVVWLGQKETAPEAVLVTPQVAAKVGELTAPASADDRLDLANNLDFYVWLANQRQAADGSAQ